MRSLLASSALSLLFVSSPSGAAEPETCRVVNDQLTTPAGVTIYLDFGQHGSSEDRARLDKITSSPAPATNRDGIRYVVDDYIDQRSSLISDHERRSARVEELARSGKIKFIGVELDPSQLRELGGSSGLLRSHTDARSALSRRGVTGRDSDRFLTSGSIGAGSYAWLSSSEVRSRTRYLPLESTRAKDASLEALRAEDQIYAELPDLVASGAISQEVARNLQARANAAVRDRRPLTSSEIHSLSTRLTDPAGAAWARSLLNGTNRSIASFEPREREVVSNALAQHENGLISFGSAHREGIVSKLESECRRMQSSSNSSSRSTTTRPTGSSRSAPTSR